MRIVLEISGSSTLAKEASFPAFFLFLSSSCASVLRCYFCQAWTEDVCMELDFP